MYDIKLCCSNINNNVNILQLYHMMLQNNMISNPIIFTDSCNIQTDIPTFHTSFIMSKNYLLLTNNTCYNIADVFRSNRFICIDIPCRHQLPNVEHYSIEPFIQNKNQPDEHLKILQDILKEERYSNYVVQ